MLVNITKRTVIVFISGLLIGTITTAAGFIIYSKIFKLNSQYMTPPSFSQSGDSEMPWANGENNPGDFENGGQLPQMPGDSNSGGNRGQQFPQIPNENNKNDMPEIPNEKGSSNSN